MGSIGAPELLIILLVLLLLFGGAKLPKLARSLGEAKNEFERGTKQDDGKPVETRVVEVPKADPTPPASDSVTMSKADLEKLIDERARRVVQPPEDSR